MSGTILGVPRDTLLKAMEVCPVEWKQPSGEKVYLAVYGSMGIRWVANDKYGLWNLMTKEQAIVHLEHAFREWLVEHDCKVVSNHKMSTVFRDTFINAGFETHLIVRNPHYLTALVMAITELERSNAMRNSLHDDDDDDSGHHHDGTSDAEETHGDAHSDADCNDGG